jgi:hypothetical protein
MLVMQGPLPLGASFDLSKNHYYFVGFSSSEFILAMFRFFDGIPTKNKFNFSFGHVQVDIHPFNPPFNLKAFKHNIRTFLRFMLPKGFR